MAQERVWGLEFCQLLSAFNGYYLVPRQPSLVARESRGLGTEFPHLNSL